MLKELQYMPQLLEPLLQLTTVKDVVEMKYLSIVM